MQIVQHTVDHHPPHFHVISGDEEVVIRIADLATESGSLKGGIPRDVIQWIAAHQGDLALNWCRAVCGIPLGNIRVP